MTSWYAATRDHQPHGNNSSQHPNFLDKPGGLTALFLYLEYWWELGSDLSCLSRAHAQIKRGSLTCPSKCACNQLTACGKPYLKSQGNQTAEAN